MDFDGVQAAVLHTEAELFVDFPETVLLEAIGHGSASMRDGLIAMLIAGYFGGSDRLRQKIASNIPRGFASEGYAKVLVPIGCGGAMDEFVRARGGKSPAA